MSTVTRALTQTTTDPWTSARIVTMVTSWWTVTTLAMVTHLNYINHIIVKNKAVQTVVIT